jgi:cellulose synthase/poly-beta-1,6-N-acetylglucosamine synthase-like glycosyltransferase
MSTTAKERALPNVRFSRVAILIPVYGNAATVAELAAQIADTLAQDYPDYLIVFVVDASPDDSWQIIRQLAQRDARICGILLKRNQGQHRALMAGLRQIQISIHHCRIPRRCSPRCLTSVRGRAQRYLPRGAGGISRSDE